jgi:hypothetical protein
VDRAQDSSLERQVSLFRGLGLWLSLDEQTPVLDGKIVKLDQTGRPFFWTSCAGAGHFVNTCKSAGREWAGHAQTPLIKRRILRGPHVEDG